MPLLNILPKSYQMETQVLNDQQIIEEQSHQNERQHQALEKKPRKRDRSTENLKKRWRTLVKTGRKLHQDYGADVYFSISISRKHKDFVFRSGEAVLPMLPVDLV